MYKMDKIDKMYKMWMKENKFKWRLFRIKIQRKIINQFNRKPQNLKSLNKRCRNNLNQILLNKLNKKFLNKLIKMPKKISQRNSKIRRLK